MKPFWTAPLADKCCTRCRPPSSRRRYSGQFGFLAHPGASDCTGSVRKTGPGLIMVGGTTASADEARVVAGIRGVQARPAIRNLRSACSPSRFGRPEAILYTSSVDLFLALSSSLFRAGLFGDAQLYSVRWSVQPFPRYTPILRFIYRVVASYLACYLGDIYVGKPKCKNKGGRLQRSLTNC